MSDLRNFDSFVSCVVANIRSVVKNSVALKGLLKESTDVIILTETWLKPEIDMAPLLGSFGSQYSILRSDRHEKRGGGVALLARQLYTPVLVFSESVRCAYEILCVDLLFNAVSVRFIVVYRAPSCVALMTEQLIKCISDMMSCN